jgi:4a-hydroxytetrahydrobiopterin dehydratase
VSALVYSYRETANGETKMTTELVNRRCKPCEGGVEPLRSEQVEQLMLALDSDWIASDDGVAISRQFDFPAYSRTLAFANAVAWIAICEGHHPELTVSYGSCGVSYTTHSIGGLSDNDFICAAKIDRLAADS